jgi:hypothetical protein
MRTPFSRHGDAAPRHGLAPLNEHEVAMHALKQAWERFRLLPMAVQVFSWVAMGLLVPALIPGSENGDTDTAAARLPTSIERATTTSSTTSSTTSTPSTTAAPTTTASSADQLASDAVSVPRSSTATPSR